ncbi:MAG TPA: DUF4126 domain-containing protein [Pyrinomonadaceae bacterium]|nr:DUF4126 domain-containing protein [Pyrinomonadaceae bacterium]
METLHLLGSTMGLGLASGLNLYATVLTVGLGIRLGLITLNAEMSGLEVLASPYVLVAAGVLFLVEFFADKVPWVDSVWDAVHTVIRPLGAAVVGATAIGAVNAETAIIAALCAGVSLSGHSVKAGTRLLANHSPEPVSNIALSLVEDGLVVFGSWLALKYPGVMLAVVAIFLVAFAWFAPKVFRLVRVEFLASVALLKWIFQSAKMYLVGERRLLVERSLVRCVAGKGVKNLRNSVGYLQVGDDSLTFVTKRLFRLREHRIDRDTIEDIQFKNRPLLDRLTVHADGKQQQFFFFKDIANHSERIYEILKTHQKQNLDYSTLRTPTSSRWRSRSAGSL